jgi:hypothetical protein
VEDRLQKNTEKLHKSTAVLHRLAIDAAPVFVAKENAYETLLGTVGYGDCDGFFAIPCDADPGLPITVFHGGYSNTVHTSEAACLAPPSHTAAVACTTAGAGVFPISDVETGQVTFGSEGSGCQTSIAVAAAIPPSSTPPFVIPFTGLRTLTDYDPATGTGDWAFTTYTGGKCNGANFDNTGATVFTSGVEHFVISDGGKRVDAIITSFVSGSGSSSIAAYADFTIAGTLLRQ